jgi:hypothetical protein
MTPAGSSPAPTPWEAANGELPLDHAPREFDTRAIPVMGPPLVLAAPPGPDTSSRPDLFDTVVLPVVQPRPLPAPMPRRESQRLVTTDRRQRDSRKPHDDRKPSAPLPLRLGVVLLFLLFLATSGAFVALQVHPSSFDALRQSYNFPAVTRAGPTRPPVATVPTHASLVSTTSSAITYSVPTSTYSIVVTISHPCWLVVRSPAGSSVPVLSKTIEPALSPLTVAVHGTSTILLAAQATSLSIVHGATVLDTVKSPRLAIEYTFVPTAS